jgi:hypothetical protein
VSVHSCGTNTSISRAEAEEEEQKGKEEEQKGKEEVTCFQ